MSVCSLEANLIQLNSIQLWQNNSEGEIEIDIDNWHEPRQTNDMTVYPNVYIKYSEIIVTF